jgi:hypothetical protein
MPFVDHGGLGWAPATARIRERYLASRQKGSVSLTIKKVEIAPGWEGRLHTHPMDLPYK